MTMNKNESQRAFHNHHSHHHHQGKGGNMNQNRSINNNSNINNTNKNNDDNNNNNRNSYPNHNHNHNNKPNNFNNDANYDPNNPTCIQNKIQHLLSEFNTACQGRLLFEEIKIFSIQQKLRIRMDVEIEEEIAAASAIPIVAPVAAAAPPPAVTTSSAVPSSAVNTTTTTQEGSTEVGSTSASTSTIRSVNEDTNKTSERSKTQDSESSSIHNVHKRPRSSSRNYTEDHNQKKQQQRSSSNTNTKSNNNSNSNNNSSNSNSSSSSSSYNIHCFRTWTDMIQDLSSVVSFMTENEHHLTCKLISICLLSYLSPHSTYAFTTKNNNDNHSSGHSTTIQQQQQQQQQYHNKSKNTNNTNTNTNTNTNHSNISNLASLEKIMKNIVQHHGMSSLQYNPIIIQHGQSYMSFWNFIYNGLRPFLSSRPLSISTSMTMSMSMKNKGGFDHDGDCDNDYDGNRNKNDMSVDGEVLHYLYGTEDLLHVLAMAISPEINLQFMKSHDNKDINDNNNDNNDDNDNNNDNDKNNNIPKYSARAEYFMNMSKPLYFEISYSQKVDIVNVLSQSLVLQQQPQHQNNNHNSHHHHQQHNQLDQDQQSMNCIMGGVAHLRSSLQTFCLSTISNHYTSIIDAKMVLSNIAIDTGTYVTEELKSLIHALMNQHGEEGNLITEKCNLSMTGNHCRQFQQQSSNHNNRQQQQQQQQRFILSYPTISKSKLIYLQQREKERYEKDRNTLCIHCATGTLLRDLILRYNGARHYADGAFTRQALAELTGAIATLLGMIEQSDASSSSNELPTSSVVASLLDAATALFYFLLSSPTANEGMDGEMGNEEMNLDEGQLLENGMKDALFHCSIQLMRSPNECIVSSASSLLALGFAYSTRNNLQIFLVNAYQTVQTQLKNINQNWKYKAFHDIIKVSSRSSMSFAESITSYLIKSIDAKEFIDEKGKEDLLSLISSIAQMHPRAVWKHLNHLMTACGDDKNVLSTKCKGELISIIFTCRLAHILPHKDWVTIHKKYACQLLLSLSDGWSLYLLTRHAFCTGNFDIAAEEILQKQLLNNMTSSSRTYLWFTTLLMVAKAESELAKEGSIGIPTALVSLDMAINTLGSVKRLASCSTAFQEELLCRRKDFLQLCLSTRGMCAEMKLTNSEGNRYSRIRIHQQNISKCFYMLASQYSKLYKRYGAIHCQQTRSSIRNIFTLCHFMGDATRKTFCEVSQNSVHELHQDRSEQWPKGDNNHIQYKLLSKLRRDLIESLNESIEPKIRAESMIEIIDIICKSPIPYPRGFMSMKSLSPIEVSISIERTEVSTPLSALDGRVQNLQTEIDTIEVQPDSPFVVYVSGILPETHFQKSNLAFSQIVAYRSVVYDGPISNNEDGDENYDNQIEMLVDNGNRDPTEFPAELLPVCEHIDIDGSLSVGSKFSIPVSCEPLIQEGYYYMEIKLFLREVRGAEYCIEIDEDSEGMMILCKSY